MQGTILGIAVFLATSCTSVFQAGALETGDALSGDLSARWTGDFDGMLERRKVRVLIPYSKTYFFLDKGKRHGLAVEWLREFEKRLAEEIPNKAGRPSIFLIPTRRDELIPNLVKGHGDIVIANLTVTAERSKDIDFTTPLKRGVKEVLVTPKSVPERSGLDGLSGLTVYARRSSSYFESLQAANVTLSKQKKKPIEIVEANEALEDEDLLEMVNAELLPAMIIDDHKAAFWSEIFDNIRVHENAAVREGGEIAWAFRKNSPKLEKRLNELAKDMAAGTLLGNILLKRYLRDTEWLKKATSEDNRKKITELAGYFRKYGEQFEIDWLLLASLAFKESRFDQNAKGPTGAVGIMQIKPSTARSDIVGIDDVSTIDGNIHAGAKYLRYLADTYFPDGEVSELDRILFALASYNAGPNRIAGLRKKSENPNIWFHNVEHTVSKEVGWIPVRYVLNIYEYYIAFQLTLEGTSQRTLAQETLKEAK